MRKEQKEMTSNMVHLLALNSLDLSAPASNVVIRSQHTKWFQLSGHADCFAPAGPGTLWKKRQGSQATEKYVYETVTNTRDVAKEFLPKYYREVDFQGEKFIEMQDLLYEFDDPCVMDVKMGTRTFLESEVKNMAAREDLYKKMVKVDPLAPTSEEHSQQAVTKLRYMQFREEQSSSSRLGFRIEALKLRGCDPVTDLKTIRSWEDVFYTMSLFLGGDSSACRSLLLRLQNLIDAFQDSPFFQRHEVIGSSLLLVYDSSKAGAWMIDFVKTVPLPDNITTDHMAPWQLDNHEEGYLLGVQNLIKVLEEVDNTNCRPHITTFTR